VPFSGSSSSLSENNFEGLKSEALGILQPLFAINAAASTMTTNPKWIGGILFIDCRKIVMNNAKMSQITNARKGASR
jgi:hypothetical protein